MSILEIRDLHTHFNTYAGKAHAVRGISLNLEEGEILGIVGESGCGKSVTMLSVMGLLPENADVTGEKVSFMGTDLLHINKKNMQNIRGNNMSMIFQDPMTSLHPLFRIGDQLTEHLRKHKGLSKAEARQKAVAVLEHVGIAEPETRLNQYPHEFSGGMRQRIMIAMALITDPKFIIADEPTTALDVTIQAQIMDLLKDIRKTTNTSIILITHDLGVIAEMCDRVIVMYGGIVVEEGNLRDIFYDNMHPYTKGLLASSPNPKSVEEGRLTPIEGTPPNLLNPIPGCPFVYRCKEAMNICLEKQPELLGEKHKCACHLYSRPNKD